MQQARARIHAHTHEIHVVLQAWCMSSVRACTNICLGLLKGVCTHLEACWITRTHAPQAPAHGLHACSHSHARTHTHCTHAACTCTHTQTAHTEQQTRAAPGTHLCQALVHGLGSLPGGFRAELGLGLGQCKTAPVWHGQQRVAQLHTTSTHAAGHQGAALLDVQSGTASSESRSCTRQARTQQGIKGQHC